VGEICTGTGGINTVTLDITNTRTQTFINTDTFDIPQGTNTATTTFDIAHTKTTEMVVVTPTGVPTLTKGATATTPVTFVAAAIWEAVPLPVMGAAAIFGVFGAWYM
jgi:hypothetical protein